MRQHTRTRLVAVLAASTLIVAACGDDDSPNDAGVAASTTGAGSDAGTASSETAGVTTDVAVTSTVDSTGGSGADRTGETIRVGYVNMDAGPFSFPEFRIGGELAIEEINATGGVDGATLEVVSCSTDLTPEASIDCANQLVEADVDLAYTAIDLASDAALPVYQEAGIPYVTTNNWGSVQSVADGSHLLHVASDAFVVGALVLMQDLGITKLANVYEVSPAAEDFVNNVVPPLAEQFGIDVEKIAIDSAAPDWTAAVATAQAGGAEMIWGQLSEPGCTGLVSAARAANFDGEIVAGACNSFIAELGEQAEGVYTLLGSHLPSTRESASDEIAARLDDYVRIMEEAGQADYAEGYATWPFGAWMELRTVLQSIDGDITAESVEEALNRDVNVPGWFRPEFNCGSAPWPTSKANCTATLGVFQTETLDDGSVGRSLVIDFFDTYARSQQ